MCFEDVRGKNIFAVGVMWATLAADLLFYGAMVPLLPMYVAELSSAGSEPSNSSKENITSVPFLLTYFGPSGGNQSGTIRSDEGNINISDANGILLGSCSINGLIIGALISLSQWTQIVSNIFAGPLVDAIGCDVPLFIGYFITVASCLGFSFVSTYATLITWRGMQGVGSAFLNTAAVAVVADMFRDNDEERGKMIGVVMCGLSAGIMLGPPFGAIFYQLGDKSAPFLAIAGMILVIAFLQLLIRIPRVRKSTTPDGSPSWRTQLSLIRDPYILMCLLLIILGYIGAAVLEGALPVYMLTKMDSQPWMTGVVFLPLNIAFAVAIPALVWASTRFGRWAVAFTSFIIGMSALVAYPFSNSFSGLLGLGVPVGVEIAAVDAAIYPMLAYLVDTRIGKAVYGSAYALANIATCMSFGLGPLLAGVLVSYVGFRGVMFVTAGLTAFALFPAGLLRKPLVSSATNTELSKLVGDVENTSNTGYMNSP